MRSIKNETNLRDKKILLRLDLNVPLFKGKISDTTRIDKILPTLKFLNKKGAKIIILSHMGRPRGKALNELSLKPICENLKEQLGLNVKLITQNLNEIKNKNFFDNFDEEILMLENIRFYVEEENNDNKFAEHLASFSDIYVNDAFSCSHRSHASIVEISKFLPSFSGLQMDLEIDALTKITSEITKPISCIIGGSKISTKIDIIKNLIPKFDNIIIVGAMANNFIEYFGHNIGKSIKEKNCKPIIEEIISLSKKETCEIIYPEDVLVSKDLNGSCKKRKLNEILNDEMILDIGPKTVDKITKIVNSSKTILWNGPAGYFENPNFANGSIEIAKTIIKNNKLNKFFSVVGGGETVSLLKSINAVDGFNFVSTAGGAFLEYLEGKKLPGITALNQ
ncbi:phosphoglycerate kinase [Candidatus Pelagibacter sp.]|nr:phosphoglycerate kinase [Candidatus Pelagibacter sp.]